MPQSVKPGQEKSWIFGAQGRPIISGFGGLLLGGALFGLAGGIIGGIVGLLLGALKAEIMQTENQNKPRS